MAFNLVVDPGLFSSLSVPTPVNIPITFVKTYSVKNMFKEIC